MDICCSSRTRLLSGCAVVASLTILSTEVTVCEAADIVVFYDTPTIDVWVYPFNQTRGFRPSIQTFAALGQEVIPGVGTFDQRDGQVLVGFDTALDIPADRGACGYFVTQASLTIAVSTDLAFLYDPTYDDWMTYIGGAADADGRPIELYGAAFRGVSPSGDAWSEANYIEGSAFVTGPAFGPSIDSDVRYVYPTDYAGGSMRDVSNNVRDGFNPKPFAIGQAATLTPGQFVPVDTFFTFALNTADEDVQAYLGRGLDLGLLRFVLTSLQPASSTGGPGTGNFATFYSKEFFAANGFWASLDMIVRLVPQADTDKSGTVDFSDITQILSNWGNVGAPGTLGDANCDGSVNFTDITVVLSNWGQTVP